MAMKPISYDVDGFPEFIRSESSARKVVERGLLAPDTMVIAYGDDGERERIRAADHPLLAPLFAAQSPAEAPAPIEAEARQREPAPIVTERMLGASEKSAPPEPPTVTVRVAATPPPSPPPSPPVSVAPDDASDPVVYPRAGRRWGLVAAIALVMLAVFAWVRSASDDGPTVSTTNDTETVTSNMTEAVVDAPAEETVTRYATREIAVRAQASATSAQMALLPRGTPFVGVSIPSPTDAQYRWLRITDGPHVGSFVSETNLSADQPPELDTSGSGSWYLTEDYAALSRPDAAADTMREQAWHLTAGQMIEVLGVTGAEGEFLGWAEFTLPRRAGVGYVPLDRLTRSSPTDVALDEADSDTSGTANEAGTRAESSRTTDYSLHLTSKCSKTIGLLLRFNSAQGQQLRGVELRPGADGTLVGNAGTERLTDSEVYFTFYKMDGEPNFEEGDVKVTFRGTSYALRRMNVSTSGSELRASFTCNN